MYKKDSTYNPNDMTKSVSETIKTISRMFLYSWRWAAQSATRRERFCKITQ